MSKQTSVFVRTVCVLCFFAVSFLVCGRLTGIFDSYSAFGFDAYGDIEPATQEDTAPPVTESSVRTTAERITTEKERVTTTKARVTTTKARVTTTVKITSPTTEKTTAATTAEKTTAESYTEVNPQGDAWYLVVVSRYKRVPADYKPKLSSLLSSEGYSVSLDSRVVPYYEQMYYDAKADGITLSPYSAYRRYSTQKNNYENRIARWRSNGYSYATAVNKTAEVILPPGASEHNLGLAVDINGTDYDFDNTAAYRWLSQNAHKYGFIQRYTSGKSEITGVVCEPWHWRFIGVEDATAIRGTGMCLEEYLTAKGIAY